MLFGRECSIIASKLSLEGRRVSEGFVEGQVAQQLHRLEASEARSDGSENEETLGGKAVHLEAATTGDSSVQAEQPVSAESEDAGAEVVSEEMEQQSEDEGQSQGEMQNLMADFDRQYRTPTRGDVLDGVIVRIDKDGILVDIGTKSEGIISSHEVQSLSPDVLQNLKVGDDILVYVLQPENQNGHVVLSLNRARAEQGWRTVQKQYEAGQTIEAEVTDFNRGGLIVNVDGVRGFVPISQVIGLRHDGSSEEEIENRMAAMVGKRVSLKVIEVNRSRNRLILSERAAMQEIRAQKKEQLLNELHEGEIRHGKVNSICDFGAFVDLGGADGLVHLSELSWGQVSHPGEVVKVGDEVDVFVLGVDREKKKIALSLRRSQPGPWARIAEKYKVGDLVTATVTKLASFGAFARIEDGVEGLIHVSELGEGRVPHPRNVVQEGDELTLRVIRIDPSRRRLGLSLKQAQGEEAGNEEGRGEGTQEASSTDRSAPVDDVAEEASNDEASNAVDAEQRLATTGAETAGES